MRNYIIEYLDYKDGGKKKEYKANAQHSATTAQAAFGMYCRTKRKAARAVAMWQIEGRKRVLVN
jgi:hypothetical protein